MDRKETYEDLEMNVIEFETVDIITGSNDTLDVDANG